MIIKEIDKEVFNEFAKNHVLKNFFQTKEYGDLMSHSDFQVMYIGGYENDSLVGASLIMHKTIGPSMRYGYAPRGFLIDYYNDELLSTFITKVKDFFFKKGFAFIKINPEITYSKIDFDNRSKTVNSRSKELIEKLKNLGFRKLKDNLYFESLLPKYTPIIYLPKYNLETVDKSILDSVDKAEDSGLKIVKGTQEDIESFYKFVENKDNKTLDYYKLFYEEFAKSDMVDLLLVELDYVEYSKHLQRKYIKVSELNEAINEEFNDNPNDEKIYKEKMDSDKEMADIEAEISTINTKMTENSTKEIMGGAFIVKNQGRVTNLMSGYNKDFESCDIKSFLYYKVIEEYKTLGFLFFDLYGITADYSDTNPYKELNKFKLKFNPEVYEYIGEFDLIVNKPFHQLLWSTNQIQKEFYRPAIKK